MSFIKEVILRSKLKSSGDKGRSFISWEKIKSIALVVDSKNANNKNLIDKFIYESDKIIDVYYIDLQVKESTIKNFISFNKTEKSFFGLPNSKANTKIKNQKYDLLINASFDELDYSSVLINTLKSTCRCGFKSRLNELDLIIERSQNQNLIAYLNEVVNYLKMIRN